MLACLALSCVHASAPSLAQAVRIGGSGADLGTMQLLIEEFRKSHSAVQFAPLAALGSSGGIKAVAAGALDIGAVSRPLRDSERSQGLREIDYARSVWVLAVHKSNPVAGLSLAELADLYAGRRDSWPDAKRVRLVLRPADDSDTLLLKRLSPAMAAAIDAAMSRRGMSVAPTDRDAADSIERTSGALGPSTLALILSEGRALKGLALDGAAPSAPALERGEYPYYKALYVVTSPRTPPPAVQQFLDFLRTPPAQAILKRTGHVVPPYAPGGK